MIFGDYTLTNLMNGKITIEWFDKNTQRTVRHLVPNFQEILEGLALDAFKEHRACAELFNLAFNGDVNAFLDDPRATILEHLEESDVIPGERYKKLELGRWHLKQFVMAYNRQHKTSLNPKEIELYTQEALNSF